MMEVDMDGAKSIGMLRRDAFISQEKMKEGYTKMKIRRNKNTEMPGNIRDCRAKEISFKNIDIQIICGGNDFECTRCPFRDMIPFSLRNHLSSVRKNAHMVSNMSISPKNIRPYGI